MDESHLSRLPPEIRNAIYEATFTSRYAVKFASQRIEHPLTATCRKLRFETLDMYLSMTRFNAHLDDGPATPLARWLRVMGQQQCLLLREVNIWDMHMLNGTLHGVASTQEMLRRGPQDDDKGGTFILCPVGRQVFHRGWYLKDIILALQAIGLGLARFCIHRTNDKLKQTSHFAIMPVAELDGVQSAVANAEILAEQFGLSNAERRSLTVQLEQGYREVKILEGRRNIIMDFDDEKRLTSIRQEFIPRDEEFYL